MSGLKKIEEDQKRRYQGTISKFAEILLEEDAEEAEIDDAIEELRPLRMWYHAQNYGDAPGFR
jgi:hypothetical protein